MRQQIADGRARRTTPAIPPPAQPTGSRPGAWPSGTRPPEPHPHGTTFNDWLPALADIREYLSRNPPTDNRHQEQS